MSGKRVEGLAIDGLRVYGAAGHLIELRADGSASLTGVDAAGVLSPAILMCGDFQLGSKDGVIRTIARGC